MVRDESGPTTTDRDLAGYAGHWPEIIWPNGARLAISVVVNFEEGAELQVGDGDPVSERIGEVSSVVEAGKRDLGQEQIFAYGMRAGLWRMLDALDRHRVACTFFMCGRAIERSPDLARQIVERGHEPACHGWRWLPHANYTSREAEAEALDRCIAATERATGERPIGFFCRGSESVHTRGLLAERAFLYTSNAFDDDLPYVDPGCPELLVVPYALDTNDMKFFHPNGFVRAREMVEYVRDSLATLLAEADRGHPRMLSIGFHLRIAGRPARFQAFEGVLSALTELGPRVWIARRDAIARAFIAGAPRAKPG